MKFSDVRARTGLPWWPVIIAPLVAAAVAGSVVATDGATYRTEVTLRAVAVNGESAALLNQAQAEMVALAESSRMSQTIADEVSVDASRVARAVSAERGETGQRVVVSLQDADRQFLDDVTEVLPAQLQEEMFAPHIADQGVFLERAEADYEAAIDALDALRQEGGVTSVARAITAQTSEVTTLRLTLLTNRVRASDELQVDTTLIEEALKAAEQRQATLAGLEPRFTAAEQEVELTRSVLSNQRRAVGLAEARREAAIEDVAVSETVEISPLLSIARAAIGAGIACLLVVAGLYGLVALLRRRSAT